MLEKQGLRAEAVALLRTAQERFRTAGEEARATACAERIARLAETAGDGRAP